MVHLLVFFGGAISMLDFTAALLFARFYRRSSDRLFLMFAIAFLILGADSIVSTLVNRVMPTPESYGDHPTYYVVRLLAFLFIIIGILDKNWSNRTHRQAAEHK